MKLTRTQIDAALLALVTNAFAWATPPSMHWQSWSQTAGQPTAYLKRIGETATQVFRGQNKYVLHYEIWAYAQVQTGAPSVDPYKTVINPILDAMDAAINPVPPSDYQSLGLPDGVGNCRWNGKADIADGSIDGQALMVIPVDVWVSA